MIQATMAKALRHYGHNSQCLKALEEMAELSVELHHHLAGRGDTKALISEVADVLIMAGQLRVMLGMDRVDEAIRQKVDRLNERMSA
jgi:NTP pyrophosphatase (non-canonical NTP hydrolase)